MFLVGRKIKQATSFWEVTVPFMILVKQAIYAFKLFFIARRVGQTKFSLQKVTTPLTTIVKVTFAGV